MASLSDESRQDDEHEPFLLPGELKSTPHKKDRHFLKVIPLPIFIHGLIFTIWITATFFVVRMTVNAGDSRSTNAYSPAQNAIERELIFFNVEEKPGTTPGGSPYAGPPRPELEEAWSHLLQYSNVRLTLDEMKQIDPGRKDDAIELPDGGYFATLQVWHELHCVKHLHRFVYAEVYFSDLSQAQRADRQIHLEHCLDTLRQGIMCRADISPITMRWGHKQAMPLGNFSSPHTCVAWDLITEWSKSRSISGIFEPGYLQHPVYGTVYTKENLEIGETTGTVHDH
ncbi:hypothetical protein BDV24DRAFT_168432 [Aspergillus arachidicola]|uniref:Tat pathway signal sequence n=1 Tax=Aspergillus arachidicola TaxID=656916 RepID=A0A5N6XTC0_9EURO|nr:hypothetical protein BDV24DRAFT_168432 [Aspergillus arachidicola]